MTSSTLKVDFKSLRALYTNDPAARAILDHFASRERNWGETSVDRIQSNVAGTGEDVSRGDVIAVFKKLEEFGCGQFKAGRKGWPSRFKWTAQMVSVGQAAAGETEQVEEMTEEDLREEEAEPLLRHTYRLRPDVTVDFDLPRSLTSAEAERLAQFVRTLPFDSPNN